jgi:Kdo2-lipid IVA lauroyltransferase/acyltransferase
VGRKRKARRKPRSWVRHLRDATRPVRHALTTGAFGLALRLTAGVSHARALTWGRWLGRVVHALAAKERKIVSRNLERAFGSELDAERRRAIERGVFESLGMMMFEAAHSVGWTAEDFAERISYEGDEHWGEAVAQGRGVLLVTGHLGNWELMPPGFLCHSGVAMAVIARDISNPTLNRRVEALRGRLGNPILSSDHSAVSLIRMLRKGGAVAMLMDQDTHRVRCVAVPFFGHPARTPVGPAFLSRRTGAPIVAGYIRRREDRPTRHVIHVHPPIYPDPQVNEEADVLRMTEQVNRCLEEEIRRAPEQWAWIHDRWKSAEDAISPGIGTGTTNVEERAT